MPCHIDAVNADPDELDRQDMKRLAAGDGSALDSLMERHGERLFRYLKRSLCTDTEAEDCAQDAFVRVYLHRAKFQPGAKFSNWLYTIATNRARNMRRDRRPETSLDETGESGDSSNELADPTANASEQMAAREQAEAVKRAVQALPEELRTPLILFEFENFTQAEIAEILRCTRKAVEVRIYRARQALRKSLAPADSVAV